MSNWTLFSNHGHVLICLARDSEARLRDVAADVGITERAVQKIVRDLQDGGMVSVTKNGRRNRYRIHKKKSLRHDLEAHCTLNDLVSIINKEDSPDRTITPEKVKTEPRLRPKAPDPIEPEVEKIESENTEASKTGSDKPVVPETKERHQGSLF